MPNWFEDQEIDGYKPMEQGGVAGPMDYNGGQVVYANGGMQAPADNGVQQMITDAHANPPPFDPNQQVGHDGSINGMTREQYRDAWMSSGVDSVAGMQDWLAKNGGNMVAANGTVVTPFGETLDMGGNAKGSMAGNGKLVTAWGGGGGGAPAPSGGPGDGAAMPTSFVGGGGGGGFSAPAPARPTYTGPDYAAGNIDLPTAYNPAAISGPENYSPERVSSPEALAAKQLADPAQLHNLSLAEFQADPSFQFRQNQGIEALQNQNAAKGLARSGGAFKGLIDYAGQSASQEYAAANERAQQVAQGNITNTANTVGQNNAANAQAYGLSNQFKQAAETTNAGNSLAAWQAYQGMRQNADQFNASRTDTAAQNNFANKFSVQNANNANSLAAFQANTNAKLGYGNLDLGYTQAGNAFSLGQGQLALGNKSADQNYDLGLKGNALGYYSAGNSAANAAGQLGLGWANYGLNADQQQFNQGYSLADMGLRASGQYGNAAAGYGAASGANATGAGNAAASGIVGSANATNAGITGAANSAMDAYTAWLKGKQ